jgi:hypothetical protein
MLEGGGFESHEVNEFFSMYVILPAGLSPVAYSTYNRNEYQKKKSFWGVEHGRCVRLITLPPSVSDCLENVGSSTSHNPVGLHGLLQG